MAYDGLGINVQLNFETLQSADKKLKKLLQDLSKDNKIDIKVDENALNKLQQQLNKLKDQFSSSSKQMQKDMKEIFNDNGITSMLNKRKAEIESLVNSTAKIKINTDGDGKVSSAIISYTDNVGKAITETYKWKATIKETENEIIKINNFKLANSSYTDNIEKQMKMLSNLKGEAEKIGTINSSLKGGNSEEFNNNYSSALSLINKLELEGKGITEQHKNIIVDMIKLLSQENDQLIKNISNDKERENALKYEQTVRRQLAEQKKKDLEIETDIQTKIKQTQDTYKTQIQNLNTKYKTLVPQDQVVKFQESLKSLNATNMKDLNSQLKNIRIEFDKLTADTKASGTIHGTHDTQGLMSSFTKFAQWFGIGTIFMGAIHSISGTIQYITEMDTALTDLSKVVDMTKGQMDGMKDSSIDLGRELGKSSVQIMQGMAEFGRVSKDLNTIKELTRTATMASNVTDLSVQDASKALTTSMINFGIEFGKVNELLDQWNEIQNNFRTSAQNLADGIGAVGAAAKQSGVSIQSLEGYLTSIISSTGVEGSEAGTAIKSMISRTFRIGTEGAEDAGKAEEALNQIGVAVRDSSGEFRNFSDILNDVHEKWSTLQKTEQVATAQAIGSTHHYSKFISLMENFSIATSATEKAINSQGSAFNENTKYLDSVQGRYQILKTNIEELQNSMLKSNTLKGALSFGNGIIKAIDEFGGLRTIIIGITTTVLLSNTAFRTFMASISVAKIKEFSNTFSLMPHLFKITAQSTGETATKVLWLGKTFDMAKISSMALSGALTMGLSIALGFAIDGIMRLISSTGEANQKLQDLASTLNQDSSDLKNKEALIQKYEELKKKEQENIDVKEDLLKVQQDLASMFPEYADGVDSTGNKILSNVDAVKKLTEAERENLKTKILALSIKAQDELPSLEKRKKELESQISDLKQKLTSGDTKEIGAKGIVVDKKSTYTSQLVSATDELQGIQKETMNYNNVLKENDKLIKDSIKTTVLSGIVNAKSIEQAQATEKALKDQGYTQEQINSIISDNTKKTDDNNNSKDNAIEKSKSLVEIGKEVADAFSKTKSEIDEANKVLDEHAKTGEWDLETILKMANDGYPQLLQMLGNDKELEQEIIRIKGDKVRATQESLNAQIKLEVDYLNGLTSGYNFDINNFASAQEAKNVMLQSSVNKRIAMYEAELNASMNAFNASQNIESQNNALRGAMYAGDKLAMARVDVSTRVDRAFSLKQLSANVGNYLGSTGSSGYDGKSGSSSNKAESEYLKQQKAISDNIVKGYQDQIDAIQKKKELEDQTTQALQKQNDLIKAQSELNNVQNEKNVKLFKDGQWEWTADPEKIKEAQEKVTQINDEILKTKQDEADKKEEDRLNNLIQKEKDRYDALENSVQNPPTSSGSSSGGTLKVGSRGDDVRRLQELLGISADGIFGNMTAQAVREYQKKHGLTIDGIVGSQTRKLLGFANGTTYAPAGMSLVGEEGAELRVLNQGDGIIPTDLTKTLMDFAKSPMNFLNRYAPRLSVPKLNLAGAGISNNYSIGNISLPNVQNGNDFVQEFTNYINTRR